MSTDPPSGHSATARLGRDWLPLGAFVFVVAALIALAVTPALLLQRVSATNREVTTTLLPTYEALRDFAFAMEQRIAASRSRFLTGDPRYDSLLTVARQAEASALRRLEQTTPRLGDGAFGYVRSIRRHAARRDSLEASLERAGRRLDQYQASLPQFDALRDSMLVPLVALRDELLRVTEARADDEVRSGRLQRSLSMGLGLMALVASLLVGWFAWRQRTLRHQIQLALDEANRQREVAERRKDDLERVTESRVRLLRGLTHDVKNPLGAARGYADLLLLGVKGPLPPDQHPLVTGIRRSVDGALGMIGDLLDLARADSGGLTVRSVTVDLRDVVQTAVADHRASAELAGHVIELRPCEGPLTVKTDPGRVQEVVGNLLSNAIKYTPPPGRITVTCGRVQDDGDESARGAEIRVHDTGPGIPASQRNRIFDEFTRLEDGGAQEGHGLGLAISRRIAQLLGGDLRVAESGQPGATFVLRLPLGAATHADEPARESLHA